MRTNQKTILPKLAYHRGRHGPMSDGTMIAENSLAAFTAALKEGAEIIELDVEAGLKICHDPEIPPESPSLEDVLKLINGKCTLNIEIKCSSTTDEVCKLVADSINSGLWKPSQFVISSFNHQVALECKRKLPGVTVGAIFDAAVLPEYVDILAKYSINNLHIEWRAALMDLNSGGAMRAAAKKHGLSVWVYTVNTVAGYQKMQEYGVDVVFTDTPSLLKGI